MKGAQIHNGRVDWVDYAKGFCIIFVVMGVIGSLGLFWAVRGTPARFLFERPALLWLASPKRPVLQPAE